MSFKPLGDYPDQSFFSPEPPVQPPRQGRTTTATPNPGEFNRPVSGSKSTSGGSTNRRTLPNPFQDLRKFMSFTDHGTITNSNEVSPMSIYKIRCKDQGCCNPKFLRPVFQHMPKTSAILANTGLANHVGCTITPLAKLKKESDLVSVKVVDYKKEFKEKEEVEVKGGFLSKLLPVKKQSTENSERKPVRCRRCRSYLNPFVRFVSQGKEFVCNFCSFVNQIPDWYFSHLDQHGKREDLKDRNELKFGSCEYVVDDVKDYTFKTTGTMTYVFCIDSSRKAKQQGIFKEVLKSIKNLLPKLKEKREKCKFLIMTFDKGITFYTFKGGRTKVWVLGDTETPMVPFHESYLIDFGQFEDNHEQFFSDILKVNTTSQEGGNCMGSAIGYAEKILEEIGGKVIVFGSDVPTIGLGKIEKPRDHFELYGSESQELLFGKGKDKFWGTLSNNLAKKGISVSFFLFVETYSKFIESGMLSNLSKETNGQLYVYSKFDYVSDSSNLSTDIKNCVLNTEGFDGILRMRTSLGLDIGKYHGHFFSKSEGEIDLCNISANDTFCVDLVYDDKLEDGYSYLQCALLYTTVNGSRRIRVHTYRMNVSENIGQIFRGISMESTLLYFTKSLCLNHTMKLSEYRNWVYNKSIEVLAKYRKFCSEASLHSQLVLPESLKFLPIFLLGLMKSPAIRDGTDIPLDQRIKDLFNMNKMSTTSFLNYVYPKLLPIHRIPQQENLLPNRLSLSASQIETSGLYLMDDGMSLNFYVGDMVSPTLLGVLWDVAKIVQLKQSHQMKINPESKVGKRVNKILKKLLRDRHQAGKEMVFHSGNPSKGYFFQRMVMDKSAGYESYYQFISKLHGEIQNKVNF